MEEHCEVCDHYAEILWEYDDMSMTTCADCHPTDKEN